MKEYIEREAAIKEIYSEIKRTDPMQATEATMNYDKGLRIAAALVMNAPTADVVERAHGEWKTLTNCSNAAVYCSVCHKAVVKEQYCRKVKLNYCPNCGADMRGEKHDR